MSERPKWLSKIAGVLTQKGEEQPPVTPDDDDLWREAGEKLIPQAIQEAEQMYIVPKDNN